MLTLGCGAKDSDEAELTIHEGEYQSFEWFWAENHFMPGLDAYQALSQNGQDDFLASVQHWGNI